MVLVRQSCAGSDWQSHVEKKLLRIFFLRFRHSQILRRLGFAHSDPVAQLDRATAS